MGIAAAVTAYAQIDMYKFSSRDDVCYTDTDSVFVQNPIEPQFVGNDLGKLKLEARILNAVFVKPKMYIYTTDKGEVKKFKGVQNEYVNAADYASLVRGETVSYKVMRMFRSKSVGIYRKEVSITIEGPDDSKRRRLFDDKGV